MRNTKPNYKAWDIDHTDFPFRGVLNEKVRFIANYGVLAPSTHNTQPWVITTQNASICIKADRQKTLPAGDPDMYGLYISIGACAENIVQAATAYGLSARVNISDDVVRLTFTQTDKKETPDTNVLSVIKKRHSNKFEYKNTTVPVFKIMKLAETSREQGVEIRVIDDESTRQKVALIHADASKKALTDSTFVKELSGWVRQNSTRKSDGMPGSTLGSSAAKTFVGKFIMKCIKKLPPQAVGSDNQLLASSRQFIVVGLSSLASSHLIKAGMSIQRFWLGITKEGMVAHPLFAMIKDEKYRQKLKKGVGMNTSPVFFMRIGFPARSALRTPRRLLGWN